MDLPVVYVPSIQTVKDAMQKIVPERNGAKTGAVVWKKDCLIVLSVRSRCAGRGFYKKMKPYALTVFARKYGVDVLLDCLEKNEKNGILYHRTGIIGDYDNKTMEEVFNLLLNGANTRDS